MNGMIIELHAEFDEYSSRQDILRFAIREKVRSFCVRVLVKTEADRPSTLDNRASVAGAICDGCARIVQGSRHRDRKDLGQCRR